MNLWMKGIATALVFACTGLGFAGPGTGPHTDPALGLAIGGIRTYQVLGFLPAPTGADLSLTMTNLTLFSKSDAEVRVNIGGGYERGIYYRLADGTRYSGGDAAERLAFDTAEGYIGLGVVNRLTSTPGGGALSAFGFVTSFYRRNFNNGAELFTTTLPDASGTWTNALQAGLVFDNVPEMSAHESAKGMYIEASAEWGPEFAANTVYGHSDYLRLNATLLGYLPIAGFATGRGAPLFALSLAHRAAVDWATGPQVPVHVRQSFGGLDPWYGLGGAVRGFEERAYDAELKALANLDVRMMGPALFVPSLIPVLVTFIDAGYYIEYGEPGVGDSALLASAGATLAVDFFGVVHIGVTAAVPLVGERIGRETLSIAPTIGLHF